MTTEPVLAWTEWETNGHMIADIARMGYLRADVPTLDPTYGKGTFWTEWRPDELTTHDIKTDGVDFTALPEVDACFGAVVFDPPYKLNGTPDDKIDERYGVNVPRTWQQRHALIKAGITECTRVLWTKGHLLVKCQDQVSSGAVRWQTIEFSEHACAGGLRLIDSVLFPSYRPQPEGRRQVHARRNYSTLLIFRKQ